MPGLPAVRRAVRAAAAGNHHRSAGLLPGEPAEGGAAADVSGASGAAAAPAARAAFGRLLPALRGCDYARNPLLHKLREPLRLGVIFWRAASPMPLSETRKIPLQRMRWRTHSCVPRRDSSRRSVDAVDKGREESRPGTPRACATSKPRKSVSQLCEAQ
jgi:hypothetical protein